ncbi:hypothetical protein B9Z45_11025 [Limnohabitans sp. 2KL-17]|nr:hypothetical protein B9Z45_11025 [Limnohabitans sp. 2KL-17]
MGQGEQKTKGISECERKIKKIKTMRGEIALANGVFQQPVKRKMPLLKGFANTTRQHCKHANVGLYASSNGLQTMEPLMAFHTH